MTDRIKAKRKLDMSDGNIQEGAPPKRAKTQDERLYDSESSSEAKNESQVASTHPMEGTQGGTSAMNDDIDEFSDSQTTVCDTETPQKPAVPPQAPGAPVRGNKLPPLHSPSDDDEEVPTTPPDRPSTPVIINDTRGILLSAASTALREGKNDFQACPLCEVPLFKSLEQHFRLRECPIYDHDMKATKHDQYYCEECCILSKNILNFFNDGKEQPYKPEFLDLLFFDCKPSCSGIYCRLNTAGFLEEYKDYYCTLCKQVSTHLWNQEEGFKWSDERHKKHGKCCSDEYHSFSNCAYDCLAWCSSCNAFVLEAYEYMKITWNSPLEKRPNHKYQKAQERCARCMYLKKQFEQRAKVYYDTYHCPRCNVYSSDQFMRHEAKDAVMPAFFRSCWSTPLFDDYCGFKYYCYTCKHYSRELYDKDTDKSSSFKPTDLKRCYAQCANYRDFDKEAAQLLKDIIKPAPQSVDLDALRGDVLNSLIMLLRQKSM